LKEREILYFEKILSAHRRLEFQHNKGVVRDVDLLLDLLGIILQKDLSLLKKYKLGAVARKQTPKKALQPRRKTS